MMKHGDKTINHIFRTTRTMTIVFYRLFVRPCHFQRERNVPFPSRTFDDLRGHAPLFPFANRPTVLSLSFFLCSMCEYLTISKALQDRDLSTEVEQIETKQ